jgi:hypothetical protein
MDKFLVQSEDTLKKTVREVPLLLGVMNFERRWSGKTQTTEKRVGEEVKSYRAETGLALNFVAVVVEKPLCRLLRIERSQDSAVKPTGKRNVLITDTF